LVCGTLSVSTTEPRSMKDLQDHRYGPAGVSRDVLLPGTHSRLPTEAE